MKHEISLWGIYLGGEPSILLRYRGNSILKGKAASALQEQMPPVNTIIPHYIGKRNRSVKQNLLGDCRGAKTEGGTAVLYHIMQIFSMGAEKYFTNTLAGVHSVVSAARLLIQIPLRIITVPMIIFTISTACTMA